MLILKAYLGCECFRRGSTPTTAIAPDYIAALTGGNRRLVDRPGTNCDDEEDSDAAAAAAGNDDEDVAALRSLSTHLLLSIHF